MGISPTMLNSEAEYRRSNDPRNYPRWDLWHAVRQQERLAGVAADAAMDAAVAAVDEDPMAAAAKAYNETMSALERFVPWSEAGVDQKASTR
jgi:hypothetical protein